ncbi:STAS domain-containing protein [Streptomyces sp. NPDC006879]|uniref:STAS domain-containing protein n=1 Tax=Streptomyces sp. NPDC006879 TaxID=3364767 RepID=UPI00368A1A8B
MSTALIAVEPTVCTQLLLGVAIVGELDIHTTTKVEKELAGLIGAGGQEIFLDLSGLTFCDSSGVDFFLQLHRRCLAASIVLRLIRVPARTARALRMLGADRVLSCTYA